MSSKVSVKRRKSKGDKADAPAPTPGATQTAQDVSTSASTPKLKKSSKPVVKSPLTSAAATVTPVPAPAPKKAKKLASNPSPEPATALTKTKKVTRITSPAPEPSESDDDAATAAAEVEESEASEDLHLHGFSTDEDSSDDEMDNGEPGVDVSSLPTIARDDKSVKRRLDRAKLEKNVDRGVIYLGRIPHGFYEEQMRAYFSQFGTVTRVRLSRSKKTGRSKHYGFLEFDSSAVAQIVAETMDNYLLMGHILQCSVIPRDKVHPALWVGANRKYHSVPHDRLARVSHNRERDGVEKARAEKRLIKRQEARKRKLADAGIDYDMDGAAYKKPKDVGTAVA